MKRHEIEVDEEHNLGFDDIGCDPAYESSQLNKPIPENDDICWEVTRFGASDEGMFDLLMFFAGVRGDRGIVG